MDPTKLLILDESSHEVTQRCTGPAPDGSCPRVAIGDILPCAGHLLVPEDAAGGTPYAVAGQATLCPVTLAAALAVNSDAVFTAEEP